MFGPKFKIQISATKLQLVVPCVKDQTRLVTINIEPNDILRVLANFGDKPLIFLLLKANACKNIRDALKMKKKIHCFLDVKSRKECQKRICLVPNFLSPENANLLRELFKSLMQEVDDEMAQDIFSLSKPLNEMSPVKYQVSSNSIKHQTKLEQVENIFEKLEQVENIFESRNDTVALRNELESQLNNNELQKLIYKKDIKKFNFSVAEIVKKNLSGYYKPRKSDPKMYKITSRSEYSNLAKMYSHQFREEISNNFYNNQCR